MTDIGDGSFQKGQPVWVVEPDGTRRAAEYVGEAGAATWFGGPTRAIVVYLDTHTGEAVEVDCVYPRSAAEA